MNKPLLIALVAVGTSVLGAAPASPYHDGWIDFNKNGRKDVFEDPSQPIEKRLDDLWRQMTFAEKLAQIRTYPGWSLVGQKELPAVGAIVDAERGLNLEQACTQLEAWQRQQIQDTRLGIPFLFIEEALHGLVAKQATSFPQATALAATWNPALMSQVAGAIAEEARTRGIRQVLSPVVDIGRDSRWGRTEETYGEDPYLVSRLAVAFCRAFESRGIVTTPKHFVADWGDGGRDSWPQYLDQRILDEVYFPPYEACIREAGTLSIMPSYGSLNGLPNICSPWLLTQMARKEWGFRGYFGSDFGAVDGVKARHLLTDDDAEVAALCLNAGMDVEWPQSRYYAKPLDEALARGLVSHRTVEDAARRVLWVKFKIGLFDDPFPNRAEAVKVTNSAAHRALALEAARQALVLLKNEGGVLPLDPAQLKVVAVIGRGAAKAQLGDYSGSDIKTVSLLDGLRSHLPGVEIKYAPGVTDTLTTFMAIQGHTVNDGDGWRFRVWDNTAGSGSAIATGTSDEAGRFNWGYVRSHHFGGHEFRARWSGTFKPTHDLAARLQVRGGGDVSLTIDGREVLNNQGTAGKPDRYLDPALGTLPSESTEGRPNFRTDFTFKAGRTYDLALTQVSPHGGEPDAALEWDQRPELAGEIARAVDIARGADAVIVVPGGIVEGEGHDRPNLGYPPGDVQLIQALAALDKPLVAVLVNGAAVTIADWQRRVPAILEAWYDGEEQGNAIADALLGRYNPGGRLPLTFPQFSGQEPLYYDYSAIGRFRGYQDPWKGRPMYPFGYGLSYTTYSYSHLRLSSDRVRPGASVRVSFDVTNTGDRAGDEVAQLYLHDDTASVVRPVEELKGFERLTLAPGQTKTVTLVLTPADLSLWNRDLKFVMEPRPITILVGSSSDAIRLKGHLDIVK